MVSVSRSDQNMWVLLTVVCLSFLLSMLKLASELRGRILLYGAEIVDYTFAECVSAVF